MPIAPRDLAEACGALAIGGACFWSGRATFVPEPMPPTTAELRQRVASLDRNRQNMEAVMRMSAAAVTEWERLHPGEFDAWLDRWISERGAE